MTRKRLDELICNVKQIESESKVIKDFIAFLSNIVSTEPLWAGHADHVCEVPECCARSDKVAALLSKEVFDLLETARLHHLGERMEIRPLRNEAVGK